MNMMQCAIHPKEYSRVSSYKSVKEMWDKLQLIYEGISEVRETKASILVSEYEMFKMKSDQTISEMFARFMLIVNGLRGLGKDYSNSDLVRKILRSLPSVWHTKAIVIEDSKNLSTMQLDELIGSLMTYEINLKRNASVITSKKPIALKASSSSKNVIEKSDETYESFDEDEDDELALLTKQFKKFLRKREKGKFKPSNKKDFSKKTDFNKKIETIKKIDIICYECRKPGHMRGECPDLKRKLKNQMFKKTRAMLATWSDEDEKEQEGSESEEEEVTCLMARNEENNEILTGLGYGSVLVFSTLNINSGLASRWVTSTLCWRPWVAVNMVLASIDVDVYQWF
ncbi:hypothetical protein Taro_000803 [Colocasia esculenta]|uniref:CCHC-type domain-containing protein n=1 Tax=Colocasia esculenta TaxID=4460 RepID=A0A843TC06_COLES|nr:hypothetical protein [Colocasia esculenta]